MRVHAAGGAGGWGRRGGALLAAACKREGDVGRARALGRLPWAELASGWLGRGVLLGRAGLGPGGVCVCVCFLLKNTKENCSRIKNKIK